MIKVEEVARAIKDITDRYGLKLLELDHTGITLIARMLHVEAKPIEIEDFVIESLEILKKLNLL